MANGLYIKQAVNMLMAAEIKPKDWQVVRLAADLTLVAANRPSGLSSIPPEVWAAYELEKNIGGLQKLESYMETLSIDRAEGSRILGLI